MLLQNSFQIISKCYQKLHSKSSHLLLSENSIRTLIKVTVIQKRKFVSWFPSKQKQYLENFAFFNNIVC